MTAKGLTRDEHEKLVARIKKALGNDSQLSFGKAFVDSGGELFRLVVRSRGFMQTLGDFLEELEEADVQVDVNLIDFQYVGTASKREAK